MPVIARPSTAPLLSAASSSDRRQNNLAGRKHHAAGSTSPGLIGFLTLGAVFLAVTGAEALYADLGHFCRVPIQTAWLGVVLPTLTINYLGQGALLLSIRKPSRTPSFALSPLGPAADERGWIPLLIGALVMFVIFTWRKGACRTLGLKGLIQRPPASDPARGR
jgi:K+ transporter